MIFVISSALFLLATLVTLRSLRFVRLLSVRNSVIWAVFAGVFCSLVQLLHLLPALIPASILSALYCLCITVLLAPMIDILGARRPGHRAWPWFVVLPMIAVLQWASFSQLSTGRLDLAVEIPTPTCVGFGLVILMGFGNHAASRNLVAALLGATAVCILLLPVTGFVGFLSAWPRVVGAMLLLFAVCLVAARIRSCAEPANKDQLDAVHNMWHFFFDVYGIVWAHRVVDRVNQFAARESWDCILSLDGFVDVPASGVGRKTLTARGHAEDADFQSLTRAIKVLCWVLRRFADEAFFETRLGNLSPDADADPVHGERRRDESEI